MKHRVLPILSWLALIGIVFAPGLYLADQMTLAAAKKAMLAATILWFATAPFWMKHSATD